MPWKFMCFGKSLVKYMQLNNPIIRNALVEQEKPKNCSGGTPAGAPVQVSSGFSGDANS
jgi:hypothetical protein